MQLSLLIILLVKVGCKANERQSGIFTKILQMKRSFPQQKLWIAWGWFVFMSVLRIGNKYNNKYCLHIHMYVCPCYIMESPEIYSTWHHQHLVDLDILKSYYDKSQVRISNFPINILCCVCHRRLDLVFC